MSDYAAIDTCIYCSRTIYLVYTTTFDPDGVAAGSWGWRWCIDPDMWDPLRLYRCERSFPDLLGQDGSPSSALVWHSPRASSPLDAVMIPPAPRAPVCLPTRTELLLLGVIKN